VPLDRINTLLELRMADKAGLSRFNERLREQHYDRMFLTVEEWYPAEVLAEVEKYYQVEKVVPKLVTSDHLATGRFLSLIAPCRILVPRESAPRRPNATGSRPR